MTSLWDDLALAVARAAAQLDDNANTMRGVKLRRGIRHARAAQRRRDVAGAERALQALNDLEGASS